MLLSDVINHNYEHLFCAFDLSSMFGHSSMLFKCKKLTTLCISVNRGRGTSPYNITMSVDGGAKRIIGYLNMRFGECYGDKRRWTLEYNQVDELFRLLKDVDDGLCYIYGEKKKGGNNVK